MTKDRIRKHLENRGYKVSECMNGRVVISKNGFPVNGYDSLSEAHKKIFGYV